ncbi:MerR family DNA-binding transcriptional regulator [Neptuniibacter sp.]|uniref:MerR family transcriptional regulator n=1 Tax=Neptuniibacter sp. TaxID=1962643 RepID=UPI00260C2636|nr:MerR family DNA-binding transcriptional regulator [Neptuniibacter sp.]MCP4595870.1 MerR family DNA-binding transcriptional regulator [Neptuniibacter sp.]
MSEQATSFSIQELSHEFNLTSRSIRFYEDKGLLSPKRVGLKRIYSRNDRVRLILILRGKRLGFSIAEIKELLELWDNTAESSEFQLQQVLTKIAEKRRELDQQLRDIAMLQVELDHAERRCLDALEGLAHK